MALNAYMTMTSELFGPIRGSVMTMGREGWIEVNGYSHRGYQPIDALTGVATMARQHTPITITKPVDRSSPLIAQALSTRGRLLTVRIRFLEISPAGLERVALTIDLTNALVVGRRQELLNTQYPENAVHLSREHVTLRYERITWASTSGSTAEDDWSGP